MEPDKKPKMEGEKKPNMEEELKPKMEQLEPKMEPNMDGFHDVKVSDHDELQTSTNLSTAGEEDEEVVSDFDFGLQEFEPESYPSTEDEEDSDTDIFSVKQLFPVKNVPTPGTQPRWNAHPELKQMQQPSTSQQFPVDDQQIEIEQEEFGIAETYSDYEPAKLKIGKRHPDPIIESSSLASVAPNDIVSGLILPDSVIDSGALSTVQLEAVIYIAQQHERLLPDGARAGFLLGDGTGVGKGRTVAGVIYDNYLRGRKKSLWISVSNDLKLDCERDLKDIGASRIKVHALNKMDYTKMDSYLGGNVQEGVVYSTYSSLIGKTTSYKATFRSRLDQMVHWCGENFDGPIIFDESHRAKNLFSGAKKEPTKTGKAVLELQKMLPKARIVYVSATGASELKNMAYMVRLGMWGKGTPFRGFFEFLKAIEKRGVGAMEIVAVDMKLRGMYMARQLSFKGVTFRIEDAQLDADFVQMYNDSVDLWVEIKEELAEALKDFVDEEDSPKSVPKMIWSQFWGAHQRFFKYLCISSKVKRTVALTKEAIKEGKCVVIGLLTTGEAQTLNTLERDEGELSEFVSTAKGVLRNFVEKFWPVSEEPEPPTQNSSSNWTGIDESDISDSEAHSDSSDSVDSDERLWEGLKNGKKRSAQNKKAGKGRQKRAKVEPPKKKIDRFDDPVVIDLLDKIESLGKRLPANTLDQLINELGGPEVVGEMTGRKGRIVRTHTGSIEYESRASEDGPVETLNLVEKQKFMDDEKHIVIISEAASSGISLQSDKRAKNQRRRVHITLEMPWSADKAMQQFGRTHRSNQANAPEYVFLISDLAGERRFASTVAKQLESLGALTHGDRRATETRDLSQFNVYNKYGFSALSRTIRGIAGIEVPFLPPPNYYLGNFFQDMQAALTSVGLFKVNAEGTVEPATETVKLTRFLNRILGLRVDQQNSLFNYYHSILFELVVKAKKENRFDLGIRDLGSAGEDVKRIKTFTYTRKHLGGEAITQLNMMHVERGMSWEKAFAKYAELSGPEEGFYVTHHPWRNGRRTAVLAVFSPYDKQTTVVQSKDGTDIRDTYLLFKPNIGQQPNKEALIDVRTKYRKVDASVAESCWREQYDKSDKMCQHTYWNGFCRTVAARQRCEFGLRKLTYTILSGSVLNIWTRIEAVLAAKHGPNVKLQVVRLKTADGHKTIGTIIPNDCIAVMKAELSSDADKSTEETFVENSKAYMPENVENLMLPSGQKNTRQRKPAASKKKPAQKKSWYGGWRRRRY